MDTAGGLKRDHRPYFLFTSRHKVCLPNVQSIHLNPLSAEDAVELIQNELSEISHVQRDAGELAETLQFFPLVLQQAIAYIIEQDGRQSMLNKGYTIQHYLKKLKTCENLEPLDYKFPNDFGEYGKITFSVWNVTLDAISANSKYGESAILVLKLLAYLYADEIEVKMFITLFKDNSDTIEAFRLLEKYSMITRVKNNDFTYYQIHRLVQTVIQCKFEVEEAEILSKALKLISQDSCEHLTNQNLMQNIKDNVNFTRQQLLHYKNLSKHIENEKHAAKFKEYTWLFNSVKIVVSDIETEDD